MSTYPDFDSSRLSGFRGLRHTGTLALLGVLFVGCSEIAQSDGGQTGDEFSKVMQSVRGDEPLRAIEGPERGTATEELDEFAWSFYVQASSSNESFVYSPLSLSTAAAMLYAGAAGNTGLEMSNVFSFAEEGPAFHQARNDLLQYLDARNRAGTEDQNAQSLRISNDFWMAPGFEPKKAFLDTLSAYYDAPVHLFDGLPAEVRNAINGKVSDDTEGLIPELLPEDSIDNDTVFVLTNALYFKSRWASEFAEQSTTPADFVAADGSVVQVDMMRNSELGARYLSDAAAEVVSIPYAGDELEFVALMPPEGEFESFRAGLDASQIEALTGALPRERIDLRFPKMDVSTTVPLKDELVNAGMVDAFSGGADFSTLTDASIFLSAAYHQAKLILDEEGTEAAAATAFVGSIISAPSPAPEVTFDQAFVFFIRDVATGAVLFVGHYVGE